MQIDLFEHYEPLPAAVDFHESTAKIKAVLKGVRGGGTYASSKEFIKRIYADVDKPIPVDDTHRRYWIVAPTSALARKAERTFISHFKGPLAMLYEGERVSERSHFLKPDIVVEIKSADRPLSLVAEGLHGVWVDESARLKKAAWNENLKSRLDSYQGWALHSSSSLGRNWFYRDILKHAIDGNPNYSMHSWPTGANTAIPNIAQIVAEARSTLPPQIFRREYEASLDAYAGQIYEHYSEDKHVFSEMPDRKHVINYLAGLDPGFHHHGVFYIAWELGDGSIWFVKERARQRKDSDWWVDRMAEDIDELAPGAMIQIGPDSRRPDLISKCRKVGLKAKAHNEPVTMGIEALDTMMFNEQVKWHVSCELWRDQGPSYRWAESVEEKPEKVDDDAPDAARYTAYRPKRGAIAS